MAFPVLSPRAIEIIQALWQQQTSLATGSDDERRMLTQIMAEQFRYEFGTRWGTKKSLPTHPASKDVIAFRGIGSLYGWDWQNGTTRRPQVQAGQEGMDISSQIFIQVSPINHLQVSTVMDMPETPALEGNNSGGYLDRTGLNKLYDGLLMLQETVKHLHAQLQRNEVETQLLQEGVRHLQTQQNPEYTGKLLRWPITLRPKLP
jgi:hypothetical protein